MTLKHSNRELKSCIAKLVRETELQNNFREKKKLKKIRQFDIKLNNGLCVILYSRPIHHTNPFVPNERVRWEQMG